MRIYVYVHQDSEYEQREELRLRLHDALTEYYGSFDSSDISFFRNKGSNTVVYITEDILRPECAGKVIASIRDILGYSTEVKLNYQSIGKPPAPAPDDPPVYKYSAEPPLYTFEQLVLPDKTSMKISNAINMLLPEVKHKIFEEWGLKNIIPHTVSALSFYGPPGTGKSMAAEAIAHKLGKKIIRASYADITSKYFGEGSKMVKTIFECAELQDAVLFIDEADSLLSKRLTDVTDGSGNAINAMRSQLLLSLERFEGIAIFATNLVVNYDKAFISRLISIEIPAPDFQGRKAIWEQHIRGDGIRMPLADDVNVEELAKRYDSFCGREIRKAVVRACTAAAVDKGETVTQKDFLEACRNVQVEAREVLRASDYTQNTQKLTKILTSISHIKKSPSPYQQGG